MLHFIGFILMAGTTLMDYFTYRTFWQLVERGDSRSAGLVHLMAKYGAFIRTGGILILLTGIGLLVLEKGIAWSRPLFKVKVVLFLLILLNGIFVGNVQGHKLRQTFNTPSADFLPSSMPVRQSMDRFYPIQLALFFLIIAVGSWRLEDGS